MEVGPCILRNGNVGTVGARKLSRVVGVKRPRNAGSEKLKGPEGLAHIKFSVEHHIRSFRASLWDCHVDGIRRWAFIPGPVYCRNRQGQGPARIDIREGKGCFPSEAETFARFIDPIPRNSNSRASTHGRRS